MQRFKGSTEPNPVVQMLMRWSLWLGEFDSEVVLVPGKENEAANSLSETPSDKLKLMLNTIRQVLMLYIPLS